MLSQITLSPERRSAGPAGRAAFSLSELVVAVAILLLMLTLAGQVMSLTIRSTGQAKALSDVNYLLRSLEQTLREDLRNIEPGNSFILIQGNPINTYWTQTGKDADSDRNPANGYPHPQDPEREYVTAPGLLEKPRADVLMLFTSRQATGFIDPSVKSELQQVVYAHADLGRYQFLGNPPKWTFVPAPDAFPDNPRSYTPTMPPAETWHLGRRVVLLMPTASPPRPAGGTEFPWVNHPAATPPDPVDLADSKLLQCWRDTVANFNFERDVLNRTIDPFENNREDPGLIGGPPFYLPPLFDPPPGRRLASQPFERSQLDTAPVALMAPRMGAYFLPRCASFKVEWALDRYSAFVGGRLDGEKELLWFDPGADRDPANPSLPAQPLAALKKALADEQAANGSGSARYQRLDELLSAPLGKQIPTSMYPNGYSLNDRFGGSPDWIITDYGSQDRANTVTFGGYRRIANAAGQTVAVPDEVFPGALRITVDLYDDAHRFERPIRHVMVIPIGE